jgi:hypothetical protein
MYVCNIYFCLKIVIGIVYFVDYLDMVWVTGVCIRDRPGPKFYRGRAGAGASSTGAGAGWKSGISPRSGLS